MEPRGYQLWFWWLFAGQGEEISCSQWEGHEGTVSNEDRYGISQCQTDFIICLLNKQQPFKSHCLFGVWSITVQQDEENNLSKQWNIGGLVSVCESFSLKVQCQKCCAQLDIFWLLFMFFCLSKAVVGCAHEMGYVIGLKTSHRNTRESYYTYKHILWVSIQTFAQVAVSFNLTDLPWPTGRKKNHGVCLST